jgi:outer membrane lipoprotein-sorting protein
MSRVQISSMLALLHRILFVIQIKEASMRWSLALALLAPMAWPVAAEENEAEKLFRNTEQKLRTAKTLQVHFDSTITGADAKRWNVKGTLTLGEGDKFRVEAEGKLFGEESKFTVVSDGTEMKSFGYTQAPGQPKQDKNETEKSPKMIGTYFRESLSGQDVFVTFLNMDSRSKLPPDRIKMSDFKLGGEEMIGERNTQAIQYTVTAKGKNANVLSMKMWLDAKTKMPVKRTMTGGGSDISDITETYSEFTVDGNVDAKLFALPK